MKKLHYMAVLFQMFHVGIIRNRISKNLMSVSLQVTVNCLCHGSSVKTQHIKEEQLDTKQLHKTSVSALSSDHHTTCEPTGVKHKFQKLIRGYGGYIRHVVSRTKDLQTLTFGTINREISLTHCSFFFCYFHPGSI